MGLIHNELRRSKLSEALTRAVGASKGAPGIERFGETLTPVIDLWSQPEFAWLRREVLGFSRRQVVAVAAELSMIALINPVNSRRIVTVDKAGTLTAAATSVQLVAMTEAQVVAHTLTRAVTFNRDRRNPDPNFDAATVVETGTDPALLSGLVMDDVVGGVNSRLEFTNGLPHILPPGQALMIAAATVNITINGYFSFRERQALPGELD